MGDEIKTLDVIDAHPRHRPMPEAAERKEDLGHRRPIERAARRPEAKGAGMRPSLLPADGVHQARPAHKRYTMVRAMRGRKFSGPSGPSLGMRAV